MSHLAPQQRLSADLASHDEPPDLERQVRDALHHLHDAVYLERHALTRYVPTATGRATSGTGKRLRQAVLDAIAALRPGPELAPTASVARAFQILHLRYVEALDIEAVEQRLGIGRTEYHRAQRQGWEAITRVLADQWGLTRTLDRRVVGPPTSGEASEPDAGEVVAASTLPMPLTSFIGREGEVAAVRHLLATARLITLTGPPGTGKTRLALAVAAALVPEFADGVWCCELAPLGDPLLVPSAVAAATGVREAPDQPVLDALISALRRRRLLLLLDNCEHVLDGCARLVDTLLQGCPSLRILATSREAMRIAGETTWLVPGLETPPHDTPLPVDQVRAYEAVRLFTDRALAVAPHFTLTDRNAAAVTRVCHRLDGVPLAIELAAARVNVLSVDQIAARLDDRFRLLTGGSRTAPPRQQTLRATLDWSYALLSAVEQALLRRLTVFSSGWTLEAAEAVAGDAVPPSLVPAIPTSSVLDVLTRLVEKSLVLVEAQGEDVRYRLLETIRQYGHEQLQAADEVAVVRQRHRGWYLRVAAQHVDVIGTSHQGAWLDRLEREHDDARAAVRWSLEQGDAEHAARLAAGFWSFWAIRGYWSEGRRHLAAILALPGPATAARGEALEGAGRLALNQGDVATARDWYRQSLEVRRKLGENLAVVHALLGVANVARVQGDYPAARTALEESLALARDAGDMGLVGSSLTNLGLVALEEGAYAEAHALLIECVRILRDLDRKFGMSVAITRLGHVAHAQGELDKARRCYEQSLTFQRAFGDKRGIANLLTNLGLVAIDQRDLAAAQEVLQESLSLVQPILDRAAIALVLGGFAGLAAARGQPQRALRLAGAAATLRATMGLSDPRPLRDWLERWLEVARSGLEAAAATAAWETGRTMPLEQAIAEALDEGAGSGWA